MDLRSALLIMLLTVCTTTAKSTNLSGLNDWVNRKADDPKSKPIPKYVQLFNRAANAYVRIINFTLDSTTTNSSDPDTIIQMDMFGPTLRAIRSDKTGNYICHNTQTGYVEVKATLVQGCLFYVKSAPNSHTGFKSRFNKHWYLAFHGKGTKKGQPKKAARTKIKAKATWFVELGVKKRRKG